MHPSTAICGDPNHPSYGGCQDPATSPNQALIAGGQGTFVNSVPYISMNPVIVTGPAWGSGVWHPGLGQESWNCVPIVNGCTDPLVSNYDPLANTDDGSCCIDGCTDATATNYDSLATCDDGSCCFAPTPGLASVAITNMKPANGSIINVGCATSGLNPSLFDGYACLGTTHAANGSQPYYDFDLVNFTYEGADGDPSVDPLTAGNGGHVVERFWQSNLMPASYGGQGGDSAAPSTWGSGPDWWTANVPPRSYGDTIVYEPNQQVGIWWYGYARSYWTNPVTGVQGMAFGSPLRWRVAGADPLGNYYQNTVLTGRSTSGLLGLRNGMYMYMVEIVDGDFQPLCPKVQKIKKFYVAIPHTVDGKYYDFGRVWDTEAEYIAWLDANYSNMHKGHYGPGPATNPVSIPPYSS